MTAVLHQLRRTLLTEHAGLTDGQLLEEYLRRRDRAVLEVIVERHGRMVWSVCRRILCNHHDAEDAFQATFLVLVRKAGAIVPRTMVANWLYGVAHQTALKARATAAKRKGRERQMANMPEPAVAECGLQSLDDELSRLPDRYRAVIVLCDLEGRTRKEAAQHLRCPEGTVAGWLARARMMLARRLARHGMIVSGGTLASTLVLDASASVPTSVTSSTIELMIGQCAASARVAALTTGVLKAMLLQKIKTITAVMLTAGLLTLTGGPALVPSGVGMAAGGEKEVQRADSPSANVQVLFAGPPGMTIHVMINGKLSNKIVAPARLDLEQGQLYRLKVSDIPNRPGIHRFPTVEIPKANAATQSFLANSAIPIMLIDRDFEVVNDGTAITKVVYVEAGSGEPNTIVSYDAPGVDVIDEANKRGTILSVLRMGNIALPVKANTLVHIEIGDDGIKGLVDKATIEQQAKQLELLTRDVATIQAENEALRQRLKDAERQVRELQSLLAGSGHRKGEVSLTFTPDQLPVRAEKLGSLLRQMAWDKYHDDRLTVRTTMPVETLTLVGSKESVEWARGVIKALNAAK
jgi:RNA polymerase sigma factor (sigma-70 family)